MNILVDLYESQPVHLVCALYVILQEKVLINIPLAIATKYEVLTNKFNNRCSNPLNNKALLKDIKENLN